MSNSQPSVDAVRFLAFCLVLAGCGRVIAAGGQAFDSGSPGRDSGPGHAEDAATDPDVLVRDSSTRFDASSGRDGSTTPDDAHSDVPTQDGATCPASAPATSSPCTSPGLACTFGSEQCACTFFYQDNVSTWQCKPCPVAQPEEGSTCRAYPQTTCKYGEAICSCYEGPSDSAALEPPVWTCGACPADEPVDQSCTVWNVVCPYSDAICTCFSSDTWDCVPPCPAAQPAAGATCNISPAALCAYGATMCQCVNGVFFCD